MGQGITEEDLEYIKKINPKIFKYVCLGYIGIISYLFINNNYFNLFS